MRQSQVAGDKGNGFPVSRKRWHNCPEDACYLVCGPELGVDIGKGSNQHDTLQVEMDNSEKLDAKIVRKMATIVNIAEFVAHFGIKT